jgi:hypothetical protein
MPLLKKEMKATRMVKQLEGRMKLMTKRKLPTTSKPQDIMFTVKLILKVNKDQTDNNPASDSTQVPFVCRSCRTN